MPRFRALRAAIVVTALGVKVPLPSHAQAWNDARTMALVTRATERRARQLADTGLTDYTATAIGSLAFLAQVGEGFPDPPMVVKADQIALEVYWRAPNHSKQLILGRRDTLLLPTDIQYHRDHLGIVQNNFPDIIRLGEGDEVRDVPHPLSAAGLRAYDFAIGDSMRIEVPGQVIDVFEVRVRPRDDRAAAAVGAVYLARADAQVVRMAFSFTRAALIDPQLEDVSIVLDNGLIEGRFWLPLRQSIEIRRSGTWLEFPARGIIRGGFEICCYRINAGTAGVRFAGPEIELAPAGRRAAFEFPAPLRTVVPPGLATVTGEDVARVQAQARELVREAALGRVRRGTVVAGRLSDLARVNRTEGLSLGGGARFRIGGAADAALSVRYGMADREAKGWLRLSWQHASGTIRIGAFDELRDASDVTEVSGLRNSVGAQEFGADFTEMYRVRGFDLRLDRRIGRRDAAGLSLGVAREWARAAPVAAIPARGEFRPALAVPGGGGWRSYAEFALSPISLLGGSITGGATAQVRRTGDGPGAATAVRGTVRLEYVRLAAGGRVVSQAFAGATNGNEPQDWIRAGGPASAPGYAAHRFVSRGLMWQRLEYQVPVLFPAIPLGRWGRTPASATLAPLASVVVLEEKLEGGARRVAGYPSVGAGLLVFFDLVRLDVARGLRDGRWKFGIDLTRDLWRIL